MPEQQNPDEAALALLVQQVAGQPGDFETALPALSAYRRHAPTDPVPCIYSLSVALTLQGQKRFLVGDRMLEVSPGQSVVTTIDMPLVSHVTVAKSSAPYLGVLLKLDVGMIANVAAELELAQLPPGSVHEPVSVERTSPALQDAFRRLMELLDDPVLRPRLAPLIEREIVTRLLVGSHGPRLLHVCSDDSPGHQVVRAVAWIKQNYKASVSIEELASRAHMSPSSFRAHFRSAVGMSPLKYLKKIRLLEARQLMFQDKLTAEAAAWQVGYNSASQFSREYSRVFGAPPHSDIQRLLAI